MESSRISSLERVMSVTSVITEREKPTAYSPLQYYTQNEWDEYLFSTQEEMNWWMDAKFGLFLHWGPSSVIGREIGWSRGGARGPEKPGNEVPVEIYDRLYCYFDPQRFDACGIVSMAQNAGFRYIVLVAKHHDGFCMWDTKTTDYSIANTPFGRDILRELADACAGQDMPFGVYFSQRDWYHPDYFTENHCRYVETMKEQIRELLTNYGKISILWFDAWYPSLFTKEHWDADALVKMAKRLQPGIIINNRCSLPGDFDTPEGVIGSWQVRRPWESCASVHGSWSWRADTFKTVKSFKQCIDLLIGCVVGGGNLLLNAGPKPDGTLEPEITERFMEIGRWLKTYGESVYGTRGGPLPAGKWGGCCARGNILYVHILYGDMMTGEDGWVDLPLPEGRILRAKGLNTTAELRVESCSLRLRQKDLDENDTVIRVDYENELPVVQADPRNGFILI